MLLAQGSEEDGLGSARRSLIFATDPPQFVNIEDASGSNIGFITLTYDNIIIACSDKRICRSLLKRINQSFKDADVVWKEQHQFEPSTISLGSDAHPNPGFAVGVCHLGVEYCVKHCPQGAFCVWRHEPKRMEKWQIVLDHLRSPNPLVCREVAQVTGIVLWSHQVSLTPLCMAQDLMDIVRELAVFVAGSHDKWDVTYDIADQKRVLLVGFLQDVLRNPWRGSSVKAHQSSNLVLFTDASDSGFGAVLCPLRCENASIAEVWLDNWHQSLVSSHIFLKELIAAARYTEHVLSHKDLENCLLHVAVDNSAAAFAMRNMYSSNARACDWLRHLHTALSARNVILNIVQVTSEDNPADCPSRGVMNAKEKDDFHVRFQRGMFAVHASLQGRRVEPPQRAFRPLKATKTVRHTSFDLEDWLKCDLQSEVEIAAAGAASAGTERIPQGYPFVA
jgi:hypothetical protein